MTEDDGDADRESGPKKSLLVRIAPLLVVVAALIGFFASGLNEYFSLGVLRENYEAIRSWIDANLILAVLLFMGVYASAVAISFPGASILTIAGGVLFGVVTGTITVVLAATLGATIIFWVAKTSLGGALRERASGFMEKLEAGFEKDAFWYLLSLRLIPAVPFWGLNIAAGIANLKTAPYVAATLLGIIPGTLVYVSIGNAGRAALEAGEDIQVGSLLQRPEILLPILGLVALSLMPIIVRRFRSSSDDA